MFMMLNFILVFLVSRWFFQQENGGPLTYYLLGYFTASFLVSSLVVLVVWLSRRTGRVAKPMHAVSVEKELSETGMPLAAASK